MLGQRCLSLLLIFLLAIANSHGYNSYKGRTREYLCVCELKCNFSVNLSH